MSIRNYLLGDLLCRIKSYLSSRSEIVRLSTLETRSVCVTSCILQGSHLAQVLFFIFVNDLQNCIVQTRHLSYADDLKILLSVSSQECDWFSSAKIICHQIILSATSFLF